MANAEHCVCCGQVIPEGSQYCVICGYKTKGKQRQIDRIRNMSVEELAEFLQNTNSQCAIRVGDEYGFIVRDKIYIKMWLESEVDDNG